MMTGMDLASSWRLMTIFDLEALQELNPDIEAPYMIFEKLRLFPQGCFVLAPGSEIVGYCIGYPWGHIAPYPLNTPIDHVPNTDASFVVHDIYVLEMYRRNKLATQIVQGLERNLRGAIRQMSARTCPTYTPFWQHCGFSKQEGLGFDASGILMPVQNNRLITGEESYFDLMVKDISHAG